MKIYSFSCQKDTENKNSNTLLNYFTNIFTYDRLMLSAPFAVCNRPKNR